MFRNTKLRATLIISFAIFSANVFTQNTTGQISGAVTDPNGAIVAGANVKATNLETNLTRETTANGDGEYAFQLLPPGRYRVEAAASGFQDTPLEVVVNITQTTSADITLTVAGAAVDAVVVEAEAPVLQSETSQNARVVTGETLRRLSFRPEIFSSF